MISKRFKGPLLAIVFLHGAIFSLAKDPESKATDLKCEHLVTPIGVDNPRPHFTWRISEETAQGKQLAVRVVVGTDSAEVLRSKAGRMISGNRSLYQLEGMTLKPFTRYYWKVAIFGKNGKECPPVMSWFETGTMGAGNWKGGWISDGLSQDVKAAPYFRKEFTASKKIVSARAYVAAAGLFECYLNGKKVGDHHMDPIYTRFDRRNLYVTFDVTAQINQGANAIGILLGNGWYNHQSTAVWDFHVAPWRGRPAFCMDLRLTYSDGTTEVIGTDRSWKTSSGELIFNSIYTAEHYDFNQTQKGWNEAGFNDTNWKGRVYYHSAPSKNIVSQQLHPIRAVEKLEAKDFKKINDTLYLYNFGRNISGVVKFQVKGKKGTVVRLKHAERLKADGMVDLSNIDVHYRPTDDKDPFQTDIITLSGQLDEFQPKFNYKGFQYVEVSSSAPIAISAKSMTASFTHSDVPPIGKITSSNPTLNKIWYAANNSYLSNLQGYPTDCPQREKNGWTGDAHIASETGLYNFDAISIYEKWMADHRDEQQPNGVLPSIIPTDGWGYEWGNGPDWTSTIAIIPWNLYLFTGDPTSLFDTYDNIKTYVNHIDQLWPNGLTTWGLGDWVPVKSKSSVELTSSAYYYKDVCILLEAAKLMENQADVKQYEALKKKIYNAFNKKFYKADSAIYGSGFQTELSIALHFGLVPDTLKAKIAMNLANSVKAENNHLDVGLLGTKSILNALSENGYADVAYALVAQKTFPSWGWWMENGATTLYENWDINAANDISLNHIMFGEVGGWMFKGIGGIIPDPANPGFSNIILKPSFVLDAFHAEHFGPQGKIVSEWETSGKGMKYHIVIPPNSTASVTLPVDSKRAVHLNGRFEIRRTMNLESGDYVFEIK